MLPALTALAAVATCCVTSSSARAVPHHSGSSGAFQPSPVPARGIKVAIIGGGPGGTSAAYFLSKAQEILERQGRGSQGFDVTLYERNERIGGRTAVTHPYGDDKLPAVELGASIFADVNRNLQRAVTAFDLPTGAHLGEDGAMIGVWDGQQFLIEGLDDGWWNSAKMLWRYGYSPVTTRKLVAKLVARFLKLYDPKFLHTPAKSADLDGANVTASGFPWRSVEEIADRLDFADFAARDAGGYFYDHSVSKLFVEEIIEAATLVNYGQEIFSIHGIGGGVSLAASGATGVKGGNYKIFTEMLGRSGARLLMGVSGEVTGIVKFGGQAEAVASGHVTSEEAAEAWGNVSTSAFGPKWWVGTKSGGGSLYDIVFVATPWHNAGITLMNTRAVIPTPPYVHLHVTLLVTNASQPDGRYFGRGEKDMVPTSILTSHISLRKALKKHPAVQQLHDASAPFGLQSWLFAKLRSSMLGWWPGEGNKPGPHLEFNSLSYLDRIPARKQSSSNDTSASDEHVVKIFSSTQLSYVQLENIMGPNNVLWVERKEWDAYPLLTPTREFPRIVVDDGLFFLNAFERLISTMETSTVSARNAVALLLQDRFGYDFVHGGEDCKFDVEEDSDEDEPKGDKEAWASWGCHSG